MSAPAMTTLHPDGLAHLARLRAPLDALQADGGQIDAWGEQLGSVLAAGGRLLVCGNGGSAAQAQHLAAELVGRYDGERRPLSAIALVADPSTITALANDYPATELFARQVAAHGRPGDVLLALSTSGRSPNVVAAIDEAARRGLVPWSLTGPGPNPAADAAASSYCVDGASTATVQEVHQVVIHLLCAAVDRVVRA